MNYMGLDIGDKNIGIAISSGIIAQGIGTYRRSEYDKDICYINKIIKDNKVSKLVVGLPKNMNGSIGFQGEKVIKFCEDLEKILDGGIKIEFMDERLTTVLANNFMLEADMSRKKRKNIVDKMAAQIILQDYLNMLNKWYNLDFMSKE